LLRDLGLSAFPMTNGISFSTSKDTLNAKVILIKKFFKAFNSRNRNTFGRHHTKKQSLFTHIKDIF